MTEFIWESKCPQCGNKSNRLAYEAEITAEVIHTICEGCGTRYGELTDSLDVKRRE